MKNKYFINKECILYKLPFEILAQKIPLIEYLVRAFKFILDPHIEDTSEFPKGEMRYALWDIISVISLFAVSTAIFGLFNNINFNEVLSIFPNPFILYFQFGYYAFWYTFVFYLLILIFMRIRYGLFKLNKALLLTLHFARCYALFIFLLFPLFVWNMNLILIEFGSVKNFTGENLLLSAVILLCSISLYIWCCIRPICKFINANTKALKVLMFGLPLLTVSLNSISPDIGDLPIDEKKICNIILSNKNYEHIEKPITQVKLAECINIFSK
jgi:hypothetical protein